MLVAKAKSDITPVPAGMHRARCVSVVDLGTQPPGNPQFKPSRKVLIEWELPDETYERKEDGKPPVSQPRRISRPFGLSLGKKATLRATLESWRGQAFTPEELDGFDISKLLGVPCYLNIVHKVEGGETYTNIASVSPLPKRDRETLPQQFFKSVQYNVEQGQDTVFNGLPEWVRGVILQSKEMQPEPVGHTVAAENGPESMVDEPENLPF